MNSLLLIATLAVAAMSGCDKKSPTPNVPTPKVSQQVGAVTATTPASDPSLPSAAVVAATSPAASSAPASAGGDDSKPASTPTR